MDAVITLFLIKYVRWNGLLVCFIPKGGFRVIQHYVLQFTELHHWKI